MSLLADGTRRWDDSSGNPEVPVLKDYTKTRLTDRDVRDKATPTVLHDLARNYKKNYSDVPHDIRKTVIRYLLQQRYKNSSETRPMRRPRKIPS